MADTLNGETPADQSNNTNPAAGQTDTVAKADYDKLAAETETLRKEKVQAELERNQKRNALTEAEKLQAEKDKDYEKLFQIMKQENEDYKSKYETSTQSVLTKEARDNALAALPEKLRSAAKDLLSKATTPEQVAEKAAEVQALAKSLGFEAPEASPVTPLNSNPKTVQTPSATKTLADQRDDLHARLMAAAGK